MGGRNGNLNRTLRIRYKATGRGDKGEKRIRHTTLVIDGNPKRFRRSFKGGKVLRITKVSQEEQLRIGDFSPFEAEAQQVRTAMRRERNQLNYRPLEVEGLKPMPPRSG